jgi:transcriptional regulator with XRE-family HTH domain
MQEVAYMNNGIGKNIADRRKELGLTQEELATRLGYKSKSTINKIELGINDIPQTKIVKFAEALHTSPSVLMGWEKELVKNDTTVLLTIRLRTDEEFLSVVEGLDKLDAVQLASVKQIVEALLRK